MKQLILNIFLFPCLFFAQKLTGKIAENNSLAPIEFALIQEVNGKTTQADIEGNFSIDLIVVPTKIIVSADNFETDTIIISSLNFITIQLNKLKEESIGDVVISVSRRQQAIEEVPVSLEIIKPSLIQDKGITELDQAVDQAPGVYVMDGQVSIRGGSGFSYGTGSRVLMVWNDAPLLSADAGDTKWTSIPIESAAQVEILKGASSVIYGAGALNGIISISEKEPNNDLQMSAKIQSGMYSEPRRTSLKWWEGRAPMQHQTDFTFAKQFGRLGVNLGAFALTNKGYREGETDDRIRLNGTVYYRPVKVKNLKIALGWNAQLQKMGNFLLWSSDSLAYTPFGGADTSLVGSSLTYMRGTRISIDPNVKYIDKHNNKHQVRGRYYFINNFSFNDPTQSAQSSVSYLNYQFQKTFGEKSWVLTSGLTGVKNDINASLYGVHQSYNASLYGQLEKKWNRFDFSGGVRFEYYQEDSLKGDSDFYLSKDSTKKLPVYPIFRAGVHYRLLKFTHLRASFGQGIRYPSIAERYTKTSVGSLNVFPNANIVRETGWAAELGIKQGVKIKNWKGFVDLSAFINQYSNMMEFTFGKYNPPGTLLNFFNPASPYYYTKWIGFRAENAESARITGAEISMAGEGEIGKVKLQSLIGYTYMNPISLNDNPEYKETMTDTSGILKYRFNHMAKADVQATFKGISLGFSIRYNSFMKNIDKVFEDGILNGAPEGQLLPGLKEYRVENDGPTFVSDARLAYSYNDHYKVSLIVNNVFNAEYSTRPGDIQAPRMFIVQLSWKL